MIDRRTVDKSGEKPYISAELYFRYRKGGLRNKKLVPETIILVPSLLLLSTKIKTLRLRKEKCVFGTLLIPTDQDAKVGLFVLSGIGSPYIALVIEELQTYG